MKLKYFFLFFFFKGMFFPLRDTVNLVLAGNSKIKCVNCGSQVGTLRGDFDDPNASVDLTNVKVYFFGHVYSVRQTICERAACTNPYCDCCILRRAAEAHNNDFRNNPNRISPGVEVDIRNSILRSPRLTINSRFRHPAEQRCVLNSVREELVLFWRRVVGDDTQPPVAYVNELSSPKLNRSGKNFFFVRLFSFSYIYFLQFMSPLFFFVYFSFCSQ